MGNKMDLDETHFLDILGEDENTRVIMGYLESAIDLTIESDYVTRIGGRVTVITPSGRPGNTRRLEDRYLVTKRELESRIQVLLAGTVAEELIDSRRKAVT